ncbi:MAG: oligosaccharide flippase family protein [Bacteroidaceae bacterium]|nr:oligosaccharide flippase family protein [Bacteroidaceae bacterium]
MSELENLHNEETNDTSYDHVLKYTGVFGGVQGLKMLVSLVRNKLTSKFLGEFGVGLISVYGSITEFLVNASNLGVPLNATRRSGELFDVGATDEIEHFVMVVRTWVLWTAILSLLICVCASPLISYFFFDHKWDHYYEVLMMMPVSVCILLAEGECAILKGLRQVRKVAIIEGLIALLTLALTVPFYYYIGLKGVVVGLICTGLASLITHAYFSFRLVSYRVSPFSRKVFFEGLPMVKKGIPYVLAGVSAAGLGMIIPAMMLQAENSNLGDVGLYRVGWTLMVAYAGMVFVALEADYFPRLSSFCHDTEKMNQTINQQVNVCLLVLTPLLILFLLFLPWIIRLLYRDSFLVAMDMAVCACFYPFFRALSLPVGYTTLAKGDSMLFLALEVAYNILFGVLIWWLYNAYGLTGAGIALSVGALYDIIVVLLVCGYKYKVKIRRGTWMIFFCQLICLAVTFFFCIASNVELKYFFGGIAFVVSLLYSGFHMSRHSDFLRRALHHFTHSSGDCC